MISRPADWCPAVLLLALAGTAESSCRKVPMSQDTPPSQTGRDATALSPEDDAIRKRWLEAACPDVAKVPGLRNREQAAITKILGEPTRSERFRVGDRQDEFRIEIQNTYPLTVPENRIVEIHEWTWEKKSCRLTVWLHQVAGQLRCLDATLWPEGTDF